MTDKDPSSTTPETSSNPVFGPPKPGSTPSTQIPRATDGPPAASQTPPPTNPPTGPFSPKENVPLWPFPTNKAGTDNWSSYKPPRRPQKSFQIAMSPLLLVLPLSAAICLDIATHSSWASISGFLTIVLTAVGILLARYRAGNLTPTAATSAALAVAAGFNLVLRSALIVTSPTWLLVVALLLTASTDLSFQTITQQINSTANYVGDIFRVPGWMVFSLKQTGESMAPRSTWLPLLRGIALATLITVPVIVLLASGDRIFASLIPSVENVDSPFPHIYLVAMFFPILAALVLTATRPSPTSADRNDQPENLAPFPIELLLVFSGLAAVLAVWCTVQLLVISDGDQIIARTAGLTKADYAREGFFQLVAVAAIVVTVIATAGRFFRRAVGQRHNWAKIGVAILTVETTALTAVALSKLNLYIESYGLTSTRLAVAWFLVWLLGTLMISTKRALVKQTKLSTNNTKIPRLMPPVRAFATAMLILFGLSNPDHFVASTNLDRNTDVVQLDQAYLLKLSSDATPVIVANQDRFDDDSDRQHLSPIAKYCSEKKALEIEYGLLGWNYGVSKARTDALRSCEPI